MSVIAFFCFFMEYQICFSVNYFSDLLPVHFLIFFFFFVFDVIFYPYRWNLHMEVGGCLPHLTAITVTMGVEADVAVFQDALSIEVCISYATRVLLAVHCLLEAKSQINAHNCMFLSMGMRYIT